MGGFVAKLEVQDGVSQSHMETKFYVDADGLCIFPIPRDFMVFRRFLLRKASDRGGISEGQFLAYSSWMMSTWDQGPNRRNPSVPNLELWKFFEDPFPQKAGRPLSDMTRALQLDALLLSPFKSGYLHFLRDALDMHLARYGTFFERRQELRNGHRWAETTCKRIWCGCVETEPPLFPSRWWKRTERALRRKLPGRIH